MSRLMITLTAAAASALAAAAIVALPALGDDGKSGGDDVASYAACLRSHGLDGAPSDSPLALKQWLGAKEQTDPATVKKAMNACAPAEERRELSSADVAKLVACMRDNGLDAPSDPAALKAWFLRMETDDPDALERVVPDCKMKLDPAAGEKAKPGVCGDDAGPKPDDPAAKPDEPAKTPEATT
jgi:hypothetical protein